MLIVLDSNVWISELALRSGIGSAFRHYIKRNEFVIGVPEVVRIEVQAELRRTLTDQCSQIERAHREMLALFGRLKELRLPSDEEIQARASSVFGEVDVPLLDMPLRIESVRAAINRASSRRPPCEKREEFRDAIIWEECAALAADRPVAFVSADKAFYEGRDYSKGLAPALKSEIRGSHLNLSVYSTISDLLPLLRSDTSLTDKMIIDAAVRERDEALKKIFEESAFRVPDSFTVTKKVFATEKAGELYFRYEIAGACTGLDENAGAAGMLTIDGDGTYDLDANGIKEIRTWHVRLKYQDAGGEERTRGGQWIYGLTAVIGHADVHYSTRFDLT